MRYFVSEHGAYLAHGMTLKSRHDGTPYFALSVYKDKETLASDGVPLDVLQAFLNHAISEGNPAAQAVIKCRLHEVYGWPITIHAQHVKWLNSRVMNEVASRLGMRGQRSKREMSKYILDKLSTGYPEGTGPVWNSIKLTAENTSDALSIEQRMAREIVQLRRELRDTRDKLHQLQTQSRLDKGRIAVMRKAIGRSIDAVEKFRDKPAALFIPVDA